MHNYTWIIERLFMDNIPHEVWTILTTASEINHYWAACYKLIYYSSLPQTTFTHPK